MQIDEKKAKIIEVLKTRGPSLPNHIAKEIELSTLITSAFLSEMASDKIVKISSLRIGSSPLYFLPGQEEMLENFINYLPKKEKDAFFLLKKNSLIEDEKLPPAYSVAIKNIKDFAVPMKAKHEDKEKIFWKFYALDEENANEKIKGILEKSIKVVKKEERKVSEEIKKNEEKSELGEEGRIEGKIKGTDEAFMKVIEEYKKKNNIEIIQERSMKKNEFNAIISFPSAIGKIDFLLVAKNKKNISDADIILAHKKGQDSKMPILFLTNGKATKKALQCMNDIGKVFIFKQL